MSAVLQSRPLALLEYLQDRLLELVGREGPKHYFVQYHPDLSPSGWHLGHCVFTESYWINEVIQGTTVDSELGALYVPELSPKPARGAALPGFEKLLDWAGDLQQDNRQQLHSLLSQPDGQRLLWQGYLATFLIQHYAQHYETLCQIRTQRLLQTDIDYRADHALAPALDRSTDTVRLPAGDYAIGVTAPHLPYDNEQPGQTVSLAGCRIAHRPVSNAGYLAFIEAGGYQNDECWSAAGLAWRERYQCEHPAYWRRDSDGHWFETDPEGPRDLQAGTPVTGISYYEAEAFACWRGARLPHEYEWEAAARAGLLTGTGLTWEWCQNLLHPYPGFEAFPYAGYSCPYFDDRHYVLRGGSRHTCDVIRRPTFRNYYQADKRHIFAGLRLAFDL